MPRLDRTLFVLALSSVVAACGDSSPPPVKPEVVDIQPKLPPSTSPEVAEAVRAAIASATAGGRPGALDRATGLTSRPLTNADIERFLVLMPKIRAAGSDRAKVLSTLEADGLSVMEWGPLAARISSAALGVKSGMGMGANEADIDVVRPHMDRILAAMRGK
jgi:hypothetical protein